VEPNRLTSRARLLISLTVFAIALTIAILRVTTLSELFGVRLSMPWTMNDFRTAIYCPAAIFMRGGNPYDQQQFLTFCPVKSAFPTYLPATLVLHGPLGLLPIDTATLMYFGLNVALSLIVVWLALRLSEARMVTADVFLGAGLLLLTRPGQWGLLLGQPALELTFATYVALYFARRRTIASGLALGVAMYKPTVGIPLGLLMLARGDLRAVLMAAGFAVLLNLPPVLLLVARAGDPGIFIQQVLDAQAAYQTTNNPVFQVYTVDLPSLISRLSGHWIGWPLYALTTLVVLLITVFAIRAIPSPAREPGAHLSVSLICLATVLSIHHNAYDLVLLVAPVVVLAKFTLPRDLFTARSRIGLLVLYSLLGANYVTTLSVLHRVEHHSLLWLVLASLNSALLLVIFSTYVVLVITRSRAQAVR
jgi:hypothetical protein